MCLTKIETFYAQPSDLITDGWKEFGGTQRIPYFAHNSLRGSADVPLDQWITAEGKDIKAGDGKTYETGFHAYADENNRYSSKTRRVYLRKITCDGQQDNLKCVIAQEMYVPSDPDGWPPKETTPPPAPKPKRRWGKG